jgi:hypothetical protein
VGDYYSNTALTGSATLSRTDASVSFQWKGSGCAPALAAKPFSIRWSGQIDTPAGGPYTFFIRSDGGVRLWVDGHLLINHWSDHGITWDQTVPVNLDPARRYDIQLEYYGVR